MPKSKERNWFFIVVQVVATTVFVILGTVLKIIGTTDLSIATSYCPELLHCSNPAIQLLGNASKL